MTDQFDTLTTALSDRYAIEKELGAGGMATVYLAEDLKHHRKVAVKVLRPELAAIVGGDRFLKEIEVTANLQHPNILPLYDSGQAGNGGFEGQFLFYVMPFVEGESLRDRLDREKQLSVEDAVGISCSVAAALDYAHRHDVVHRDIKPENVMLTDGQALVADFGIALAVSEAGGTRLTETGLSLGTPYYMSPEQATGDRELDARSDVYALGCVTYEMLTGDPPHTGATAQAIIASVMTEEPRKVSIRRPTTPPNVEAAVHKAMAKIPADRFATAAQFAEALAKPEPVLATAPSTIPPRQVAGGWWNPLSVATTAATVVLLGYAAFTALRPASEAPVIRYGLQLPDGEGLSGDVFRPRLAFSPSGDRILYVGPGEGVVNRLWLRPREAMNGTPLFGTELPRGPFFSPDGTQFGFARPAGGTQHVVVASFSGGTPLVLVDTLVGLDGGDWGTDGYVYYDGLTGGGTRGIMRVPATGGPTRQITTVDTARGESDHVYPHVLPAARGMVFTVIRNNDLTDADVAYIEIGSNRHRILTRGVSPRYVPTGHLLFVSRDGILFAAPFNARRGEITGPAVEMARGLNVRTAGAVDLTLSERGRLAYVQGGLSPRYGELVWVDRTGRAEPIDADWIENFGGVAISPDGTRLVVTMRVADFGGQTQLFVKTLDRQAPPVLLTPETNRNDRPRWAADGQSVLFRSDRQSASDIFQIRADGGGTVTPVLAGETNYLAALYSPDQRWLIYLQDDELYARRTDRAEEPIALGLHPATDDAGSLSADGRWLAYVAMTGDGVANADVFVVPFPNTRDGRWRVSLNGGLSPVWSRDGRELFYRTPARQVISVAVEPGAEFSLGERRVLFNLSEAYGAGVSRVYDVMPDGERFVMIRMREDLLGREIVVVESFFAELRGKVGN